MSGSTAIFRRSSLQRSPFVERVANTWQRIGFGGATQTQWRLLYYFRFRILTIGSIFGAFLCLQALSERNRGDISWRDAFGRVFFSLIPHSQALLPTSDALADYGSQTFAHWSPSRLAVLRLHLAANYGAHYSSSASFAAHAPPRTHLAAASASPAEAAANELRSSPPAIFALRKFAATSPPSPTAVVALLRRVSEAVAFAAAGGSPAAAAVRPASSLPSAADVTMRSSFKSPFVPADPWGVAAAARKFARSATMTIDSPLAVTASLPLAAAAATLPLLQRVSLCEAPFGTTVRSPSAVADAEQALRSVAAAVAGPLAAKGVRLLAVVETGPLDMGSVKSEVAQAALKGRLTIGGSTAAQAVERCEALASLTATSGGDAKGASVGAAYATTAAASAGDAVGGVLLYRTFSPTLSAVSDRLVALGLEAPYPSHPSAQSASSGLSRDAFGGLSVVRRLFDAATEAGLLRTRTGDPPLRLSFDAALVPVGCELAVPPALLRSVAMTVDPCGRPWLAAGSACDLANGVAGGAGERGGNGGADGQPADERALEAIQRGGSGSVGGVFGAATALVDAITKHDEKDARRRLGAMSRVASEGAVGGTAGGGVGASVGATGSSSSASATSTSPVVDAVLYVRLTPDRLRPFRRTPGCIVTQLFGSGGGHILDGPLSPFAGVLSPSALGQTGEDVVHRIARWGHPAAMCDLNSDPAGRAAAAAALGEGGAGGAGPSRKHARHEAGGGVSVAAPLHGHTFASTPPFEVTQGVVSALAHALSAEPSFLSASPGGWVGGSGADHRSDVSGTASGSAASSSLSSTKSGGGRGRKDLSALRGSLAEWFTSAVDAEWTHGWGVGIPYVVA